MWCTLLNNPLLCRFFWRLSQFKSFWLCFLSMLFFNSSSFIYLKFGVKCDNHFHWISKYVCLWPNWIPPPGNSHCVEDTFVAILCREMNWLIQLNYGNHQKNMWKWQQQNQRADNSQSPSMGLQRREKIPLPEMVLSWSLNYIVD